MKLREIKSRRDWYDIKKLYKEAFPASEKRPFRMIRRKYRTGEADVLAIEKDGEFAGLAITMNGKDMVLLDYFAICSDRRNEGIGAITLKALQDRYSDRRFFLEIENADNPGEGQEERVRRKRFYLANGMKELGVQVSLFGVDMELLGYECRVDFEEYRELYQSVYGKRAAKRVVEVSTKDIAPKNGKI